MEASSRLSQPRSEPTFWIGDIPLYGDTILAPMAGYADVPHRALCRAHGAVMAYTEFVAAEDILAGARNVERLLDFTPGDTPMVFQIFSHDPERILRAALLIEPLGPDIIDVNMGCSTRRVSGRGAGVGMMPRPKVIAETFDLLTRHLSLPVTGKIRLGWDDNRNYRQVGRIMEDNGAAMVAIHPRTKEQRYGGQANWEAIAELKQVLNIPVIGGGDIRHPYQIERLQAMSGCDAVMIGRGAIGNPWIFGRRAKGAVPAQQLIDTIKDHVRAMIAYYGCSKGLQRFRKYLERYLEGIPAAVPDYRRMVTSDDPEVFFVYLEELRVKLGQSTIDELMAFRSA